MTNHKVKEAMVEFSPVFLFFVFHICAMLTEWRLNHLGRKKLRSTEIDKELRYLHLCSGSLSHFCVARLYHCCVVYIYHLCVVFLHHPCGSSPPLVCGLSLSTLFVGPFHLNQNFPINHSPNFCFHTHKFVPKLHEFAQGGNHRCSSVGLVGCLCVLPFMGPGCWNSPNSTASEWIGTPYCRASAFFFVRDTTSASIDSSCLALLWPSSS